MHPTEGETKHQLYLMCDDIQKTLEDLATKGVEISGQVSDEGWGQLASIKLPSGSEIALYEPRHAIAHSKVTVTFALRVGSTQ